METPKTGYQVQSYSVPVKRYCQTLDLRDSPELIAEYRKRHSQAEAWPEILAGIREVGILEMEIYILGTRLFMIVETPLDFPRKNGNQWRECSIYIIPKNIPKEP